MLNLLRNETDSPADRVGIAIIKAKHPTVAAFQKCLLLFIFFSFNSFKIVVFKLFKFFLNDMKFVILYLWLFSYLDRHHPLNASLRFVFIY